MTLNIIKLSGIEYYSSIELCEYDHAYFGNIKRRSDILKMIKINPTDYIYAYEKDNKWIVSYETYKKAKILFKKNWADQNVPKLKIKPKIKPLNNIKPVYSETDSLIARAIADIDKQYNKQVVKSDHINEVEPINVENLYDIPPAPEILDLEDEEKFKDLNGNLLEIEVRGERNHKKCFFKVKDISNGFELPRLQDILLDINKQYITDVHHKFFNVKNPTISGKINIKKELYLTYKGILKVLFSSRSGNAESFQDWATETLFTVQMGTENAKHNLIKSMFNGASIGAIKEAFKTSSGKTPCVYLFVIGNANELLKTDIYSADTLLYKFGYTDDLPRRSGEHERDFKKIFKVDHIELMIFSVIDPKYISDAETSLKDYFKSNKVDYANTKELITLTKTEYEKASKHYTLIKNSYIGCYMEMQDRIDKLERKIKDLQNEYDLKIANKNNELNLIIERTQNELQQKENIIELIKERTQNELQQKENIIELIKERTQNELLSRDKELKYIKNKYLIEMALKEKEHQNELLLMKTQMLELQLTQVSKSKISKTK